MLRRLTPFFLILCICWQSLAFAGAGLWVTEGEDAEHALLHFETAAHHHDEHNGDFHQDDSTASVKHALGDAGIFAPGLMPSFGPALHASTSAPPLMAVYIEPPPPLLQGLERPPKHTS